MKREILFKAKKQTSKMWYFGDYWFNAFTKEHYLKCLTEGGTQYEDIKIDIKTLCQFTGKLDVNKNKIFENDVVQYSENPLNKVIVVWNKRTCGFVLNTPNYKNEFTRISGLGKLKVVSNIHDK